jgi:tetratricopeptide (TPR) repeat protein
MTGDRPSYDEASLRAARQVVETLRASDLRRANELSNRAILDGLRHPALFNARAIFSEASGRIEDALADFKRTRSYVPDDANLLLSIGLCLLKLGRASEAVDAFDAASIIKPNSPAVDRYRADALIAIGDSEAASQAYEKAIAVDPKDAKALASLAALTLRHGETARATELATRSLTLYPDNPAATLTLANAELVERQFASAERRLRALLARDLDALQRTAALSMLGDALDGMDDTKHAFEAYSTSKAELRQIYAPRFVNGRAVDAANALIELFEAMPAGRWASVESAQGVGSSGPRAHVFLLGFMRSGTTLLELALASNPDVVVMDEHDLLRDTNQTFLTSAEGIEQLADLGQEEISRRRSDYWAAVGAKGIATAGRVFVDKLPFHTAKLPIIAKLFPKAKILFCLRDPRDVVFSSFRRPFEVNATIFEFLSLEDGARFYDSIMRLASIYRRKLPLEVHDHRYEAMVENFEESLSEVCDFIGIAWSEKMRAFGEAAKTIVIRNPSAAQVRRPLNSEGIGQWRRYREQIAPIIPLLAPWVAVFGYPAD